MIDIYQLDMESALEHSYKDFHCKGLHYLCLKRTPELTLKVYFFEGDAQDASEVVNPHNHRYDFKTTCLSGKIMNKNFQSYAGDEVPPVDAKTYCKFDYLTPLNGGDGFTWRGVETLAHVGSTICTRGESYDMSAAGFHTIQVLEPNTVIALDQYVDVVPLGVPTQTFTVDKQPPSLAGLYSRFKSDEIVRYARILNDLISG